MTKNVNVEDDEIESQIDLSTLMAHARKIDENIAEQEYEANRQAAIQEFGLSEPAKGGKATKADQRLTEQLQVANETIADLEKTVAERDEQITRLTEQLQAKAESNPPEQPAGSAEEPRKPWDASA